MRCARFRIRLRGFAFLLCLFLTVPVWGQIGSLLLSLVATPAQSPQPVETALYLTGAAGGPRTEEQRALYLKAGFHLIGYSPQNVDWGRANDMYYIGGVSNHDMPPELNRPFEDINGMRSNSIGLFTHLNFTAPPVVEWWETNVPQAVRKMPGSDRIAFWKVHNEFGYHSDKIYDYSEGTVAIYRKWLQDRYRSIEELNRQWKTGYSGFDAIDPPRTDLMRQLPNWLEWRRFTSWNLANYFKSTGDLIRSVVPGAKVSDNFYFISPLQGWDMFELARQTDYLALDMYEIGNWMTCYEYLDIGRSAGSAYGKPFLMMEYHAGPNDLIPVVRGRDLAIEANAALARESRAISWYMWRPAQDGREQGIHGMLDMQGKPTERYTVVAEVSAQTARLAPLLLKSRVQSDVAIATSSDSAYLAYANGKESWNGQQFKSQQRWNALGHILDTARIQWDFLDGPALLANDLKRYKAIILGHVPVVSDDLLKRLDEYMQTGGTVITHPDVALLDGFGHPRKDAEFEDGGKSDGLWIVRTRKGGGGELVTAASGKGRRVSCAWELPGELGTLDVVGRQAVSYAGMLEKTAGVQPALSVGNVPVAAELDARRLQAGNTTLVFLTSIHKGTLRDVTVAVPKLQTAGDAFLFDRALGSTTRIPVTRSGDGVRFTVPQLDPAVIVLLGGPWQPIVGIDAPKSFRPGDVVSVSVTVDNLDALAVSGSAKLLTSAGWKVTPVGKTDFAALAPGKRVTLGYRVTVPAEAAIDRFAIENPLVAEVTFTSGRTGSLSARHLPFVEPPLDILLTYRDQILNPWQELSPPLMRWGWENDVLTPPPPPIAIKAAAVATINVSNSLTLAGRRLVLSVTGPGEARVEPEQGGALTLTDKPQAIPLRFHLSKPGPHRLTVTAGDRQATVDFVGGADEETARAALTARKMVPPQGWQSVGLLGAAAREAPANGQPVTVQMKLSEQQARRAAVFAAGDGSTGPVAASISSASVALAVDVRKDDVSTYLLAVAREGVEVPRPERIRTETDGDKVVVRGDNYAVTFNRALARMEAFEVAGKRFLPKSSHIVAITSAGSQWSPDSSTSGASLKLASSPVEASVELQRPVGPAGEGLTVREKWVLQARHVSVSVSCHNLTKKPIAFSHIGYRLGMDTGLLPNWRLTATDGSAKTGQLPSGFSETAGVKVIDFLDAAGNGLAITLGRCALNMKGDFPFTVRHSPERSEMSMVDNLSLDPADDVKTAPGVNKGEGVEYLFAEFEFWPHGEKDLVARKPVVTICSITPGP